jgi:hypothetical protein
MDSPKTLANIGYTKHRGGKIKKKTTKTKTEQHNTENQT